MSTTLQEASKPKAASEASPLSELPAFCTILQNAKAAAGLTFEQIAAKIGRNEVWVAAVFYGQGKPTAADLEALAAALDLPELHRAELISRAGPHFWPTRGVGPPVPTDPLIYRLYEGVLVFGHPIKAIIHEKFGDGIMSMIDCKINIERKADPKGDRVVLTYDGKFLSYNPW